MAEDATEPNEPTITVDVPGMEAQTISVEHGADCDECLEFTVAIIDYAVVESATLWMIQRCQIRICQGCGHTVGPYFVTN